MNGPANGVFVDTVAEGGWAALGRMRPKDIILAVDGRGVASVLQLAAQMKALAARRPPVVVLAIRREARTMFIEIKPAWR